MKCCHCEKDSKYSEWETTRRCPACGRRFVFIPRGGDPCSDVMFARAIEAVSSEGSVRWGVEHLYYELDRRIGAVAGQRHRNLMLVVLLAGCLAITFALIKASGPANQAFLTRYPLALPAGIVGGLVAVGVTALLLTWLLRRETTRLDRSAFERLYERWVAENGAAAGVIERRPAALPPEDAEPDLGDYSFDRAVICDRARTVDLLLANNFHFENNCAVLSVGGYPKGPFEVVRAMLKRNPQLAVYALHDATPEGCRLAHTLANDPEWFAGRTAVIDVGLRPSQAAAFAGSFLPGSDRDLGDGEGVTAWEKAWLAKYRLEIAVIRPEQVVKRLFRAINQPPAQEPGPGNVVYLPRREPEPASSTVFVGDSGGSYGEVGGTGMAAEAHDADGGFDAFG